MAKGVGENMSEDETDKNIFDDPEEDLWECLKDYVWADLLNEEKVNYARTIHTLVEKFGNSYGEILARTGWSESAGGLAKRVRKILGSDTQSLERKATKVAKKQISDIIGKEIHDKIMTDADMGDWIQKAYGPVAEIHNCPTSLLIATAMEYWLFERPKMEALMEEILGDDIYKTAIMNDLVEAASPNFIAVEKLKLITRMIEFITLIQLYGGEVSPELFPNYIKALNAIEQGY